MSCRINVTGGIPPSDRSYTNLTVQDHLVARKLTAQKLVAGVINADQILVNGLTVSQISYFANDFLVNGPVILLTPTEVTTSFPGIGSTANWPLQFNDPTYWSLEIGPGLGMRDGSVGAFIEWKNVYIPEDGLYEFRQLYSTIPVSFTNTNGTYQIFVDGVAASSNSVDMSVDVPPSDGGIAQFTNISLTEGSHNISLVCVGGTGPGTVGLRISGNGVLLKM